MPSPATAAKCSIASSILAARSISNASLTYPIATTSRPKLSTMVIVGAGQPVRKRTSSGQKLAPPSLWR